MPGGLRVETWGAKSTPGGDQRLGVFGQIPGGDVGNALAPLSSSHGEPAGAISGGLFFDGRRDPADAGSAGYFFDGRRDPADAVSGGDFLEDRREPVSGWFFLDGKREPADAEAAVAVWPSSVWFSPSPMCVAGIVTDLRRLRGAASSSEVSSSTSTSRNVFFTTT